MMMNSTFVIYSQWALVLGIIFLLSTISFLVSNKRRRDAIIERFDLQRRRTSGAKTPPRSLSLSLEKIGTLHNSEKDQLLLSNPNAEFINSFPPSRRYVLAQLAEHASAADKKALTGPEPSIDFLRDASLPTTRSYDLENDSPKYTPTGFSTAEIKALGNFPRYDILSGVPLPEPYEGFDPDKALPRPYRPFRWAYHQTMCQYFHHLT